MIRKFLLLLVVPSLALAQAVDAVPSKLTKTTAPVVGAVSVTSSATALPSSIRASRTSVCIYNNGTVTIYLGPSGVTTSNGIPLQPGAMFCDDARGQAVYGIVASGTCEARVWEN